MRPACITATSSAMYSTTPMLCVMNQVRQAELALQLLQHVEDPSQCLHCWWACYHSMREQPAPQDA